MCWYNCGVGPADSRVCARQFDVNVFDWSASWSVLIFYAVEWLCDGATYSLILARGWTDVEAQAVGPFSARGERRAIANGRHDARQPRESDTAQFRKAP